MMLLPLPAMHIPDGLLSIPVSAIGWGLLLIFLTFALRHTRQQIGERQIPLMGILAAFVFAAQMLNFPVAGGTSGHLLGGTLVAIFLGPWAAVLVMTCVIGVQGFLFQDGGLLPMGFNIVNMGILSAFSGFVIYSGIAQLPRSTPVLRLVAAGIGAWAGVVLASVATALELAASGISPLGIALPAMVSVHLLIGIGEALITVAALAFVWQTRPDLIENSGRTGSGSGWIAAGMGIALLLAFASPLASPAPDGLERVAQDHGFADQAQPPAYSLLPDYTVPFIESDALTTIAAGVIGVLVVSGVGYAVARLSTRKQKPPVSG